MRRVIVIALVIGAVAWWRGWRPGPVDVPAMVAKRAGCDPSYPTVCIASPPPYLECRDIRPRSFKVFGRDPHGFDPDRDGLGCND
jgi:micrococcal nuclease